MKMASCRFVYLAVIFILCTICVGILALEADNVNAKYKKLVSKIFNLPSDDPHFASVESDDKCNAVCVPKHLCVNGSVVVNGAGMLSLRMSNRFGEHPDQSCGGDIPCCLNDNAEFDEDDVDDEGDENGSENGHAEPTTTDAERPVVTMGCGFRYDKTVEVFSSRIASGTNTYLGEYPWIMAIGLLLQEREYFEYRGSGSLIHPRVVLTAAHILRNQTAASFITRAGEWDLRSVDEKFKYQDRTVERIIRHKDFEAATLVNDIALLIVAQPFELTPTVNTICLPKPNLVVKHNTKCTASGWGRNVGDGKYQSILRKVDVPFVARRQCQQQLRRTRLGMFYQLHRSLVCAGGRKGDDACEGDGGAPLISELPITESRFYQIGIVAGGMECAAPVPGLYVNVAYFIDWIRFQLSLNDIRINDNEIIHP